jgi:hypothetical protein
MTCFYDQVIAFVKRQSGAHRVVVFDHTLSRRLPADPKMQTRVQRPAVLLVHSDQAVASGPQRVRDLLQRRVAFCNLYKPATAVPRTCRWRCAARAHTTKPTSFA